MTSGVPPWRVTASTVAAPRPDAPPGMITWPKVVEDAVMSCPFRGFVGSRCGDQVGRGVAGDGGDDDHLATVVVNDVGLGQVVDRIVAALDPDVRPQPLQQRFRRRLVEDGDRV